MWGQATAEPLTLTRALVAQRHALARLRVFVGIGIADTLKPEQADAFDFIGYNAGGPHRALAATGVLDILPCHYSQLPGLIRSGALRVDALLLQVSPPDEHGRHSLGLAHEYLGAALDTARVVIAEVNPQVPWVPGERSITAADVAALVPAAFAPVDAASTQPGPVEQAVAAHVAGWVDDGATLQLGIGNLPEAVLAALHDRRHLGLHTGAVGEGIVALAESGALTHARKSIDRGVGTVGLLMGGERLRRWAHRNPTLQLRSSDYTHDAAVLASIDRLVAINSAIEVDLTGQVNAEVAAGTYVGAVGGAMDFLRAAARSRGGVPIVALPSTAKASSRIVATLSGPVSTPRADAGVIVTEHGSADLRGQPLGVRVKRMIAIAGPEHREALAREAHALLARSGAVLGR
ncbi:MAG: acetyl-CoA hydrolase/transferase family protein [Burkholderiales bacterium]|nr:acetyl-CoA hydrolase/transferase family protein [Burkholderiales bacterium]